MIDLCEYAVSVGEKAGADEIEAVWMKNVSTSVKAQLGEPNAASKRRNEGMRIRVIEGRALSSVFTYRMDKDNIGRAVQKAIAAARASRKDENWDSLPHPKKYPHIDVWDPRIEEMSSEDLVEPVIEMLHLLPDDISAYLALNEIELLQRACVNTHGIEHMDRGTLEAFGMVVVGKLEDGVTPAFDEISYLRKYNPNPEEIAEPLVRKVNLFRKTETSSSGKSQIILSPQALEILFRFTLFKALSGENVARGKTLLAGKEGEEICSSAFTLHDSGVILEGSGSKEMDDEGVPCQDTPLIENGKLQGFIWNDYWAKRMDVSSTGNAHYDDRTDEISIRENCMVIAPGDFKGNELFDIKDGYYVLGLQGAHGSNPESGDFSVVCTPAFRIRNGEISGGVVGMMLSDNVFSLLENVDAVASESEVCETAILPHIRFKDVNMVAK
jgi:PmbA protein